MKLTNQFSREQLERGVPVSYIKKAAVCLGRQPDSEFWVLNEDVHMDNTGATIPTESSKYIWLGSMIGNRNLPNIAPPFEACYIPMKNSPQVALDKTLLSLKEAVDNNYLSAFFLIASAGMSMHYDYILNIYGMCPTAVAIGPKNTGKSTAAKTALSLIGSPQFFIRDFTSAQTASFSSRKTFPTVFDDPSDIGKIKGIIANSFNSGGRSMSRRATFARSVGIVTLNLDRVKLLCSNFKYVINFLLCIYLFIDFIAGRVAVLFSYHLNTLITLHR